MKTYDIMKDDGQWKLVEEGSERALRNFATKAEAVSFGRDYVHSRGGVLRIWKADGVSLQEERTYEVEEGAESVAARAGDAADAVRARGRGLLDTISRGAADASEAAVRFVPQASRYLSRGVYGTAYYGAYGVVFGAVTLGRMIPFPAPMVRGVHDGTEAAIEASEKSQHEAPAKSVTA